MTLLFALLSFSLFTPEPKPIPMAVPPSNCPHFNSEIVRFTIPLSLVIGVWVKLSPAYTTIPILSFGLLSTKFTATFLRASNLFGFKSLANMLADTSMAITISIPLFVFVFLLTDTFLGLASAIIIADKASSLNRYRIGFNFDKNEPPLKPFTLGIVKTAVSFLRIKKCQTANSGISISNQRNSGFKNSKLLQFIFFFYYLFRL